MNPKWATFVKKPKINRNNPRFKITSEELQYKIDLFLFQGGEITQMEESEASVSHQKQTNARLYQNDTANAHEFLMGAYDII